MGILRFLRRARRKGQKPMLNQPGSRLLALPGEIRNIIYKMVLELDSNLAITSQPFPEPPLLRTCKAVRREASSIFYYGNKFEVDCPNWEHSTFRKYYERLHRELGPSHDVTTYWVNSGSRTSRANLVRFLQAVHSGKVWVGFQYPGDRDTGIGGAFEMVRRLEAQKWETVASVLEVYLDEVAKAHLGWRWD